MIISAVKHALLNYCVNLFFDILSSNFIKLSHNVISVCHLNESHCGRYCIVADSFHTFICIIVPNDCNTTGHGELTYGHTHPCMAIPIKCIKGYYLLPKVYFDPTDYVELIT